MKPNIKDLSFKELTAFLSEHHHPVYRAKQVWQWLFQKRAITFAEMTNLSRSLREQLDENFSIGRLQTLRRAESRDGTVKFLFGLVDEVSIESVLIPEPRRLTLCVSTQAGCGFGCAFCATAILGLKRNLTTSEIVDQILEASRTLGDDGRITHVVLMGMGEPLANYDQTVRALQIMTDGEWGIGISPRRVTLSTVGLVPQIEKLMAETRVNLAISLHAPNDELRGELMPVNRKYSLKQAARLLPLAADTAAQAHHLRICLVARRQRFRTASAPACQAAARYSEQGQRDSIQSPSRQLLFAAGGRGYCSFRKRFARCRRADQRAPAARR